MTENKQETVLEFKEVSKYFENQEIRFCAVDRVSLEVKAGEILGIYEPFGIYGGKCQKLEEVKEGASIGIPNDVSNQARALWLLESLGWIKLPEDMTSLEVAIPSVVHSKYHLDFQELAAEQLPRSLKDLDFAIINGNYALEAGLDIKKDALKSEDADSLAAKTYANILACRQEDKDNEGLAALVEILQSQAIKDFMDKEYQGAVVPAT